MHSSGGSLQTGSYISRNPNHTNPQSSLLSSPNHLFCSFILPYSRKPCLFVHVVTGRVTGVTSGVHNIALLAGGHCTKPFQLYKIFIKEKQNFCKLVQWHGGVLG